MEPAPYGGFMTRTIDEENTQKEQLQKQQVPVVLNGQEEMLRPEAVHVRGVDNLSTDQIESFVEKYLNPDTSGSFRIQWIDDSNANVVFKTHDEAKTALSLLSESWSDVPNSESDSSPFSPEYLENILSERPAKSYADTLEFHKDRMKARAQISDADLFEGKKAEVDLQKEAERTESMEEDGSSIVLYVRQSVQSDRKAKNAKEYSRYYLLHGEPDRTRPRGRRGGARGQFSRRDEEEAAGGDLFATKLEARSRSRKRNNDEKDLFAWRLRERSPGRA